MATSYTSLLGFALPVTGELQGVWGQTVNNSITQLCEDSIAGVATASVTSADWTLTTTGSGASNQARMAILIPTGTPGVSRNIIAPSSSKTYTVINQSNAAVVLKGAATTGVTIAAGDKVVVVWNGSDFVSLVTTNAAGVFTTLSASGTVTLSGGTANGVAYLNASKVLTTGSALTFDGTTQTIGSANSQNSLFKQVIGSGGANEGAVIVTSATGKGWIGFNNGNNASIPGQVTYDHSTGALGLFANTGPLTFSASGSEQMRLTNTGLGIGTSSPTNKLTISGTAATGATTFLSTGTTTNYNVGQFTNTGGSFYFGLDNNIGTAFTGSSAYGGIVGTGNSTSLGLVTNGSVKATLDTSGNLGLGVTPSAWSGFNAFQVGVGGSISGTTGSQYGTYVAANTYNNGSWRYLSNNYAVLYQQYANSGFHAWYNAPSGTAGNAISFTQAMTLTASGNLGIGSTNPISKLEVTNSGIATLFIGYNNTSANYYDANTQIFRLGNSSTETMRLDSSGNLLVGTTSGLSGTPRLSISYDQTSGYGITLKNTNSGNSTNFVYFTNSANGGAGSISQNGATGVLYNTASDYRLKIVLGSVSGSGERIDSLEPVEYEWKSDGLRARGFLAHKFQEVYPSSVTGEKDAVDDDGKPVYQTMQASTAEVIADLVAEIQSLRKRITTLEAK